METTTSNLEQSVVATETHASGLASLGISGTSLLFQLINFVILLLILKKFVFNPIIKAVDQRQAMLKKSVEDAKAIEQQKNEWDKTHKKLLVDARTETQAIITEARKSADKIKQDTVAETKKEQQRIIDRSKQEITEFQLESFEKAKKDLAEIIINATKKITRNTMSPEIDAKIVEKIIKEK